MKRVSTAAILILALTLGVTTAHAASQSTTAAAKTAPIATTSASDVVKGFYAQLVETMKQGDQLGFGGRFKKLQPTITAAFDLPLMTRFAVGSIWTKATPNEQQQLVSAFSDFSVANYASQFKKYDGEQFDVVGEKSVASGTIVETKLKPKDGDAVTLSYMMRKDDKGIWRIVDVYLDGSISQLATRRAEFTSIVDRDGIAALVNSLGEKSKQMGPS